MTIEDYWDAVGTAFLAHIHEQNKWRWGQSASNVLKVLRPDLANQVINTDFDPFYVESVNDAAYLRFTEFIEKNWG